MSEEMQQEEGFEQMEAPNGDGESAEVENDKIETVEEQDKDATMDDDDDTEDDRKLFVGGLSWETSAKELREHFEQFGEVSNCTLKTDYDTKKSRGFGFVCFASPECLDKVLAAKEHKLHGRTIDPKKAQPRPKKIFVGKVDPAMVEDDVKEYFSQFGEVEKMEFPYDKNKDQRRAFCFIEFKKMSGLKKCLDETSHKIKGQEVDVKKATPPQGAGNQMRGTSRGRGFGGPGGRGGRGAYHQHFSNYNQGYPYGGYGGYAHYDGYGNHQYGGYGHEYGGYGGYGGNYNYPPGAWNSAQGFENYNGALDDWGYGQGGNQPYYGKTQKRGASQATYHPYSR